MSQTVFVFVRRWIVDAPSGLDLQRTVDEELWETGDETWYYYNCAQTFSLRCCAVRCWLSWVLASWVQTAAARTRRWMAGGRGGAWGSGSTRRRPSRRASQGD